MGNFQKILKPSKYRAVDTSGNNNHGQIYSGRGLEFDGVSDYINAGSASSLDDIWINGATIAAWIYCEDASPTKDMEIFYKGAGTGPSQGWSFHVQTNGKLRFICDTTGTNDGNFITSEVLQDKTWYRVVVTYNLGSSVSSMSGEAASIYINGIKSTLGTSQALDANYNTDAARDLVMGAGATNHEDRLFEGMMSDAQIWDSEWTQSDVTFDYLNPESLALNNGGTSLTESNLKLWYPMQDGHRGQQSYIMDGAGTGLGDEIVVNGDYSDTTSTDSSVSALAGWANAGTHSGPGQRVTISNGQATIVSDGTDIRLQQTILTSGVTYKYSVDIISNDGAGGTAMRFEMGSGTAIESFSTVGTHTGYFTADNTSFRVRRTGACNVTFDNISVKPVNDKHHATTEFLGDEQINEQDNRDFSGSNNDFVGGTVNGSNTNNDFATYDENATSGATEGTYFTDPYLKIISDDDDINVQYCKLDGAYWETFNGGMVVGRTYRLSYSVEITTATKGTLSIGFAQADATATIDEANDRVYSSTQSATTHTIDFVYAGTTTHAQLVIKASTESVFEAYFDNFSLKEVGVASGWTDADQQLDIPQTALQSYNQLAWFAGAGSNQGATLDTTISTTTTDWSMSFWIFKQENFENFDFFMGSSTTANFAFDNNANRKLYYRDAGGSYHSLSDNEIPDNEWVHIVITVDGNTSMTAYVNGEVQDTDSGMTGTAFVLDRFMNGYASNQYETRGCITEIAYFANRKIGQTNVNQLYNDGKAYDARNINDANYLTHYWRNNGLAEWKDLVGSNDINCNATETLLLPAGVDASRDTQGFLMNRQKNTNSLNFSDANGSQDVSVANEYVEIPRNSSIDDIWANGGSISCWIKPSSDGENNGGRIFQKRSYISVASESNGKLKLTLQVPFSSTNGIWTSNENNSGRVINIGEWNHIVITYNSDSTSNVPIYYINNATEGHSDQTPVGSVTTNNSFDSFIGNSSSSGVRQFDGQIDDILIYNDILSADEVDRIYKAGKRSHR